MCDDSPFLRQVLAHPFDDGPRLVWADALDERGDPRGEFVRVQCELARWPCECDTSEERVYHEECRCKEREELQRRERELAMRRCAAWAETDGVMKALGTDHVRRLGLSMGYTDLEFSLDGRPVAIGNFRRGLVGSVTLTAAKFLGGPCKPCGGTGDVGWRSASGMCLDCFGSGRTKGVAAALFAAAPVTEVRLSDREPFTGHEPWTGMVSWYAPEALPDPIEREDLPSNLPSELFALLEGGDYRAANCGRWYDTPAAAHAALSAAAVALGRARVELPALARAVSANFFS